LSGQDGGYEKLKGGPIVQGSLRCVQVTPFKERKHPDGVGFGFHGYLFYPAINNIRI